MGAQADRAAQLRRLAVKYRTLAELRARREELEAQGLTRFNSKEARARSAAFRRVAREFPGSLRELDTPPAEVLLGRHDAVLEAQRAFDAGTRAVLPLWMELAIAYHGQLREALAIKRWLV